MKKARFSLGAFGLILGIGLSSFTIARNHGAFGNQVFFWYNAQTGVLESNTPSVNPPDTCPEGSAVDCAFGFINKTDHPLDGGQNETIMKGL